MIASLKSQISSSIWPVIRDLIWTRAGREIHFSFTEIRQAHFSFSQFGEDLQIFNLLGHRHNFCDTYYVDVGAFHPIQYSNTLLFHRLGARGINIDMDQSKIDIFNQLRANDINICSAVGPENETFEQLEYTLKATNRLNRSGMNDESLCGERPIRRHIVNTQTLNSLLEKYPSISKNFILLNIDCEGLDFDILKTIDLYKWHPKVICIESHDKIEKTEKIKHYLQSFNYQFSGRIGLSCIFLKTNDIQII